MTEHDPTSGHPGDPAATSPTGRTSPDEPPADQPTAEIPPETPATAHPVDESAAEAPAGESLAAETPSAESAGVEPRAGESLAGETPSTESAAAPGTPQAGESAADEPVGDAIPAVGNAAAQASPAGEEPAVASVGEAATTRIPATDDNPTVGASAGSAGAVPPADGPPVGASAGSAGAVPPGSGPAVGSSAGWAGGAPAGDGPTVGGSSGGAGAVPPGEGSTGGSTAAGFPAGGVPPSSGPWSAFTGRRLARSSQRKVIAGVAGGLGEYTGIDPVLFRVLFAVLTLFGGSGILLYVVGWLFMPTEEEQSSPIESLLHRGPGTSNRARDAAAAGALIVAGLVLASVLALGDARDLALVLVVVGGAFFLVRNLQERRDGVPQPPAVPGPPPPPPAPYETPLPTYQPPAAYQPQPAYQPPAYEAQPAYEPPPSYPPVQPSAPTVTLPPPPAPAPPPRGHSALGVITISVLLVVLGVAAALTAAGAIDPEPDDLLALAVGTIGAGLVVGAWFGRARWLTWLGVPLLIALIVLSASNVSLKGGAGDRQYAPQTAAEVDPSYRIGVGNIQLDLSAVDFSKQLVHTKVSAGVGNIVVIVPRNADVNIDGRAGIGEVDLLGQVANGTSATRSVVDHPPAGDGTIDLTLDLDVSIGRVEVDRAAA